ncbi:MAG TPA: T9SS type A sorting domain-containing protein [Cytophagales bacterium]|nr:T9SS type A sorting domain-containing protein [Cytophagales bacterium]
MKWLFFFFISLFSSSSVKCQIASRIGTSISCYENGDKVKSQVARIYSLSKRQQAYSKVEFIYESVPEEAKITFEYAAGIWETFLNSPVPIRVKVIWSDKTNALATTGPTTLYMNFEGSRFVNVWYPVALAEKLAKKELNPVSEPDIEILINKNYDWYYGTDGNVPSDKLDLLTIVLHEIAHGLGFISSASVYEKQGIIGEDSFYYIYDLFLKREDGLFLTELPNPSYELLDAYQNNSLFFQLSSITSLNQFPRINAPSYFIHGESISHLDELAYPIGNENSLLSAKFSFGESIHVLGDVLSGILVDIGWGTETEAVYPTIYPNPTDGVINFNSLNPVIKYEAKVLNALGTEVLEFELRARNLELPSINLEVLPKGVYLIILSTPGKLFKFKTILMK